MGKNFDLLFVVRLFLNKKYIVVILAIFFMYMLTMKDLRVPIYFKTQGVLYIVNESKVFGLGNLALQKILPNYKGDAEKESIREYIKNTIVLGRTIVNSGYNVYFHENEENYEGDVITAYKWIAEIKNIYNLKIRNIYQNYKVTKSKVLSDRLKKVTLKIIFNNNTVEIFDLSGKKIGFLNLKENRVFKNSYVKFKIEKLDKMKKIYDGKTYLTIVNQNYMVDDVMGRIKISKKKQSALAMISFRGDNPFLIKSFVDTLMDEYIKYNIEIKFKNIDRIVQFLNNELKKLLRRRDEYVKSIYELEKKHSFPISEAVGITLVRQMAGYKKNLTKLRMNLRKIEYMLEKLKKNKISNIYFSEGIESVSSINNLINSLLKEIQRFNRISEEFTKNSPVYKEQLRNVKKAKRMLEVELEYKVNELKLQIDKLDQTIRGLNNKILSGSVSFRKVEFYQREISIIDIIRQEIYTHLKNLMTDKIFIKYGNRVMKYANLPYTEGSPVKNKIITNIILSVIFSLVVLVIKYFIFPVFYSKMEIPNKDKIIGGIPQISDKMLRGGIIKFSKDNKMFELFRLLMSMMVVNKRNFKVILFTSSYPNDGRTFMAMNFATIAVISGKKKVLVITIYPINTNIDRKIYNFNEVLNYEEKAEKVRVDMETFFYRFYCVSKSFDTNIDISDNDNEVYEIVKKLKDRCDFIIFDCLAYPMYADTFLYAQSCDIVFSIMRLYHTPIKLYSKHLNDLEKYIKEYNIIINSDRINLNSSGYILEEKGTLEYYKEKIKYIIARI